MRDCLIFKFCPFLTHISFVKLYSVEDIDSGKKEADTVLGVLCHPHILGLLGDLSLVTFRKEINRNTPF